MADLTPSSFPQRTSHLDSKSTAPTPINTPVSDWREYRLDDNVYHSYGKYHQCNLLERSLRVILREHGIARCDLRTITFGIEVEKSGNDAMLPACAWYKSCVRLADSGEIEVRETIANNTDAHSAPEEGWQARVRLPDGQVERFYTATQLTALKEKHWQEACNLDYLAARLHERGRLMSNAELMHLYESHLPSFATGDFQLTRPVFSVPESTIIMRQYDPVNRNNIVVLEVANLLTARGPELIKAACASQRDWVRTEFVHVFEKKKKELERSEGFFASIPAKLYISRIMRTIRNETNADRLSSLLIGLFNSALKETPALFKSVAPDPRAAIVLALMKKTNIFKSKEI